MNPKHEEQMPNDITEFADLDPEELHLVPLGANGYAPLMAKGALRDVSTQDGDITEFESFDPERVDAVKGPANGTPFLMLKQLSPQESETLAEYADNGTAAADYEPHRKVPPVTRRSLRGSTAPDKADRIDEALSQTRQVQPDDITSKRKKANAIEVDNPDRDQDNNANNQTATKEVDVLAAMTNDQLIALLDERDRAKKEAKAAKKAKKAAASNPGAVIKGLRDRLAMLENQPAGRPFLNASGLQAGAAAPVLRGAAVEGDAFKSLENRVEKARERGDWKEHHTANAELAMAKMAANERAAQWSSDPRTPYSILGDTSPDAHANARAALGSGAPRSPFGAVVHRV